MIIPTYKNTLSSDKKVWVDALDCMLTALSAGYSYIIWKSEVMSYEKDSLGRISLVLTDWTEQDVIKYSIEELQQL